MNELSTKNRAEELAEAIVRNVPRLPHCYDELTEELGVSEASVQYECDLAKLIEQALRAERRLAMGEAAKIADNRAEREEHIRSIDWSAQLLGVGAAKAIAEELRAAAEKEVGK